MPMKTIFSVDDGDLNRLGPQEAVEFFRELLWAEARGIGLPISKIAISIWIDIPDGGIDASIEENISSGQSDLIRAGQSGYQIKTGTVFKPWQEAQIRKELFEDKEPSKDNLGSSVRECLDKSGRYVLVCFVTELTVEQHKEAIKHLRHFFEECGYQDPKVEVWGQSNLIGFIRRYPSLALALNGRDAARFQTHKSWSMQDDMRKEFKSGKEQEDFIEALKKELQRNDQAIHVRVWGEPGIGKTKLVLEATRAEDLKPLVIYCDAPNKFRDSDLMNQILRDDNQFHVILVIDECDFESRAYIWNKLAHRGPRIKLITIYNEHDDTVGNTTYAATPGLDREKISGIIQEYGATKEQADRWSELCGNSPRVAHVIGWNLKNNPEDLLKPPDTVNVWSRYIVGGDDPSSSDVQQRYLLLRYLALFKRFGYGQGVVAEAQAIAKLVERANTQVTWQRFQEIIKKLKERKILQGENTLYITPKALHIKLWLEWWETYGNGFDFNDLQNLPGNLLQWFGEMFRYAAGSEMASGVAQRLLGPEGPFEDVQFLQSGLGANWFSALAEAAPDSALSYLKTTIGTWSKEKLSQFTTGRMQVVWALKKIAEHREYFHDASRLLLQLGEAENEPWSGNASRAFAELFSLGYGPVAPTETAPKDRFPVLKETLESESKERRMLALRACNAALEAHHFFRFVDSDKGLQKERELWAPKTWGELFDAYRQIWGLLRESLDSLPAEEQKEAVNILLGRARGLSNIANLADMVIDTMNELARKPYVDKKKILTTVIHILRYDGKKFAEEIRRRWEQLKEELTGSDFSSLMKRYVGLDLLEDRYDEQGKPANQVQPRIEELAQRAIEDDKILLPELGWLVAEAGENRYRFGYELGKHDKEFSLMPVFLTAQNRAGKAGNTSFLGGYFRALFERNPERWEKILDSLMKDSKLNVLIPELTRRSGMSDRACLRIITLAQSGVIDIHQLKFGLGGDTRNLSEDMFQKLMYFILGLPDCYCASAALELFYFYYLRGSTHTLPKELTVRLLTDASMFKECRRDAMDFYYWKEIGTEFIKLYPEKSLLLADKMLEHFGEDGTILSGFHSQTTEVLNEITKRYPAEVWNLVKKYLVFPMDSRAFRIEQWLRGNGYFKVEHDGLLALIPLEKIWEWVDENAEVRAIYIASIVPPALFRESGKVCLAREVLIRYGHKDNVRRELIVNFSREGWSGPASLHYQAKKESLLGFKQQEDNENVKRWIDEYVSILDKEIEHAKIEEERYDF